MSEKSQVSTRSSMAEHQDLKTSTNENALLITSDSTTSQLKTIIWPIGKFKYSVDNGFVGEAEKVEQVSFGSRLAKISKVNQKQVDLLANLDRESTTEASTSKAVKVKNAVSKPSTMPTFIILFGCILFILLAVAILVLKLKKFTL